MGGHLSKPNEIFAKIKNWRHSRWKKSPRPFSWKTWMKSGFQAFLSRRVWHAEQSEIRLWGVICQNPTRYSQKSKIDVIFGCKSRHDLFLGKLEWNQAFKHFYLEESGMLNNLRFAYGGSFVKTQRDIRKNQKLTSFSAAEVATTCFLENLNEIMLSSIFI